MAGDTELSIIILNYNTKELLADCLNSIKKYEDEISLEVIVSDNASSDGSAQMVKKKFPWVKLLTGENSGFSKGNNRARPYVHGDMVLFLNPDTVVTKGVLQKTTEYLINHKEVGALSCKLVLPSGELDKDARRRFPTPGIAFMKLFLGNGKRYWYEGVDPNKIQEVDAIQGAFFLTWKSTLDKVNWFSEEYFFNGEDLDLCWKIKKDGWKIIYYPDVFIYHLKGASTGKSKFWKPKIAPSHKVRVKMSAVDAMEIFYRKNLWSSYPLIFNLFVILGIKIFKLFRWFKFKFFSK
jgi:hypothetical protein